MVKHSFCPSLAGPSSDSVILRIISRLSGSAGLSKPLSMVRRVSTFSRSAKRSDSLPCTTISEPRTVCGTRSLASTPSVILEDGMVTKALSWVSNWNASPARFARQIRLVPTSSPTAVSLALSRCCIAFLLAITCCLERFQNFFVFFSKDCPVFGDGQASRRGFGPHLIVGQRQSFPESDSGVMYERRIVIESERVDTGRRRCIVIAQSHCKEREVAGPIGVITDQHVAGVHRHLRVSDAVGFGNVILAAQHLGQDARGVNLRRIGGRQFPAGLSLGLESDPEEAAVQVDIHHLIVRPDRHSGV